jgi:hypothetical protein
MPLNQPELTQKAINLLRNPDSFEWYLIPMLAFVIYIYFNEISKKNWKGVAAAVLAYDAKPKNQIIWITSVAAIDAAMMIMFAGFLHWI